MLKLQTTEVRDTRRHAYETNAAYGVIPCNHVRQPILTTLDSPMKLQSNFQPGIPSKADSTLLEILARVVRQPRVPGVRQVVSTLLEILCSNNKRVLSNNATRICFNPS